MTNVLYFFDQTAQTVTKFVWVQHPLKFCNLFNCQDAVLVFHGGGGGGGGEGTPNCQRPIILHAILILTIHHVQPTALALADVLKLICCTLSESHFFLGGGGGGGGGLMDKAFVISDAAISVKCIIPITISVFSP